jgi:hypothetical protein
VQFRKKTSIKFYKEIVIQILLYRLEYLTSSIRTYEKNREGGNAVPQNGRVRNED